MFKNWIRYYWEFHLLFHSSFNNFPSNIYDSVCWFLICIFFPFIKLCSVISYLLACLCRCLTIMATDIECLKWNTTNFKPSNGNDLSLKVMYIIQWIFFFFSYGLYRIYFSIETVTLPKSKNNGPLNETFLFRTNTEISIFRQHE